MNRQRGKNLVKQWGFFIMSEDLIKMPEAGRAHPACCRIPAQTPGVPFSCPRARTHEAAGTAPGHRHRSGTDEAGLPELACPRVPTQFLWGFHSLVVVGSSAEPSGRDAGSTSLCEAADTQGENGASYSL